MKRMTCFFTAFLFINLLFAQQAKKGKYGDGPVFFIKIPDIQNGLKKLGFSSPHLK